MAKPRKNGSRGYNLQPVNYIHIRYRNSKGGERVRHDFLTYEAFRLEMQKYPQFSFQTTSESVQVYYDYKGDGLAQDKNYNRQLLFSVSTIRAFAIVAPYGYRLITNKKSKDYNRVALLALQLANTPIYYRKEDG